MDPGVKAQLACVLDAGLPLGASGARCPLVGMGCGRGASGAPSANELRWLRVVHRPMHGAFQRAPGFVSGRCPRRLAPSGRAKRRIPRRRRSLLAAMVARGCRAAPRRMSKRLLNQRSGTAAPVDPSRRASSAGHAAAGVGGLARVNWHRPVLASLTGRGGRRLRYPRTMRCAGAERRGGVGARRSAPLACCRRTRGPCEGCICSVTINEPGRAERS